MNKFEDRWESEVLLRLNSSLLHWVLPQLIYKSSDSEAISILTLRTFRDFKV